MDPPMPDPVRCRACGEQWERHPCLEIACPACEKPVGVPCRGDGNNSDDYCVEREAAALEAGFLQRCPAPPPDPRAMACPQCGASAGSWCKRPSGHAGPFVSFHKERVALSRGQALPCKGHTRALQQLLF